MAGSTEDVLSQAAADRLLEESWQTRSRRLPRRELLVELAAAALFLLAQVALLRIPGATTGFDPSVAAALVVVYVIVARVEFPIGAGNVVPTQLVLVPMFVLLPPAAVPILVAAGLLLAKGCSLARGRASLDHLLFSIPDAWHAVGPAAVLLIGGRRLDLADGDQILAAFVACCLFDAVSAMLRETAVRGVRPTLQLQVLALVWVVDGCLAPIGFLAAKAAQTHLAALLLVLPLAALLALMGRDRRQRIEQAQHRLEVAVRERSRLQAAVRRMGDAFAAKLDLGALLDTTLRGSIEALDADAGSLQVGNRRLLPAGDEDLDPVLRMAAAGAGHDVHQVEHSAGWAVGVPFFAGDPGTVCVGRHDRPFQPDEIALLAELVAKAQAAAGDIISHNELQQEAAHDQLTGLGNRRKLSADAGSWLTRINAEPRLLMLLDLDGFKQYNDMFGHLAGDALLSRLGARLAAEVAPYGSAYRLGGDEFCAVLEIDAERVDEVIAIATHALGESGEEFTVTASVGVVLLPHEAHSLDHALQLADERMYAHKHHRAGNAREQARDVLMRTMQAKQPYLRDHSDGVAQFAIAVARRFGMTAEEIDEVARAAELHDVGKVGIPDAILEKPGPLDRDEWEFMYQHTILGERILNAAPALRPVAHIVRSTHERWDGTGYPDGLAGEQIPLGARIVAVCDAYEAMTSDRAYRLAMSHEDACEELKAMAGTQFDPAAVDGFIAELEWRADGDADAYSPVQDLAARVRTLLAQSPRAA